MNPTEIAVKKAEEANTLRIIRLLEKLAKDGKGLEEAIEILEIQAEKLKT
ncbi:MAG: hypothetical protein FWG63_05525 [Defluviitaleaceae bacterium]|nr:hypothetical protein [Defluviitaleaceae bacterium]